MNFIEQIMWAERSGYRGVWKPETERHGRKQQQVLDPDDQIQRCLHCPYTECRGDTECSYRKNGILKKRKKEG